MPADDTPPPTRTQLPAVYATDQVIRAFATGIDALLNPLEDALDTLDTRLDPWQAPAAFLPWLAQITGARTEPGWPEHSLRTAIDLAPWLAAHRGTPHALLTEASYVYGWPLTLADPGGVLPCAPDADWPDTSVLEVTLGTPREGGIPADLEALARLIAAHCPAHLPYRIAPPQGQWALYAETNQGGQAWFFTADSVPDLRAFSADNTASSVYNNTAYPLDLFADYQYGGAFQTIEAGGKTNIEASLNDQVSSVKVYAAEPRPGWYALYTEPGCTGMRYDYQTSQDPLPAGISSVWNKTNRTLEILGPSGAAQLIHPGRQLDLIDTLDDQATAATVHNGPPTGAYCLYDTTDTTDTAARQWVYRDSQPTLAYTSRAAGADNQTRAVVNNTDHTLELCQNTNYAEPLRFVYPQQTAILEDAHRAQTSSVKVYQRAEDLSPGLYGLFDAAGFAGRLWVFRDTPVTDLADNEINASATVSSVANNTDHTLELCQNTDYATPLRFVYPQEHTDLTGNANDAAGSVRVYKTPADVPTDAYCLFEKKNHQGKTWAYRTSSNLTDGTSGAAGQATSITNNTSWTLELLENTDGTGPLEFIYPGQNRDLTAHGTARRVLAYTSRADVPTGAYCLFEKTSYTGKTWAFRDRADLQTIDGAGQATSAANRTPWTLELFTDTNDTGPLGFVYPDKDAPLTTGTPARRVHTYTAPTDVPTGAYCLFADKNYKGKTWAYRDSTNLFADGSGANDRASSVVNHTGYDLTLYTEANETGSEQTIADSAQTDLDNALNDNASSIAVHREPRTGEYALYEKPNHVGERRILKGPQPDLALPWSVASVWNNTDHTLELFTDTSYNGTPEPLYPQEKKNLTNAKTIKSAQEYTLDALVPDGAYCLYSTNGQHSWLLRDSRTDLTTLPAYTTPTTATNNTHSTLALYKQTNYGTRLQLISPNGKNTPLTDTENQPASTEILTTTPNGTYTLIPATTPTRRWTFDQPQTNLDTLGLGSPTKLTADNKTDYTIELFYDPDHADGTEFRFVHPGQEKKDLAGTYGISSVAMYSTKGEIPDGTYCLFENTGCTGKTWVFRKDANLDTEASQAADAQSAYNNTNGTIELFKETTAQTPLESIYPRKSKNLTTSNKPHSIRLYRTTTHITEGLYALFSEKSQAGTLWGFRDSTDLTTDKSGADNAASSVYNNTGFDLSLYTDAGNSGQEQKVAAETKKVDFENGLDREVSSVTVHRDPSDGEYGLYESSDITTGRRIILTGPQPDLSDSLTWKVAAIWNKTDHTLDLFDQKGFSGTPETVYPGKKTNLATSKTTVSVQEYAPSVTVPQGAYCLYSAKGQQGKTWVFRNSALNLDSSGADNQAMSVANNTMRTLILYDESSFTGKSQDIEKGKSENVDAGLSASSIQVGVQAGQQTYRHTGKTETFTVPAGVRSISVHLWGAGGGSSGSNQNLVGDGGGGGSSASNQSLAGNGGGGGYTRGTIEVTPGSSLEITVGGAGTGGNYNTGGGGGGLSGLASQGTFVLIAGGGGGCAEVYQDGGAGGGLTGEDGEGRGSGTHGQGGSETAGGKGGYEGGDGSSGKGGDGEGSSTGPAGGFGGGGHGGDSVSSTQDAGGGGGGGYFGGGGGGEAANGGSGGGGGGSGLASGDQSKTETGQGTTPGGTDEDFYEDGVGVGGGQFSGPAGNGLAVITWSGD
ncbi:peptidase inhibitor family I36 protein [Streptomyces yunnanensis]|uniref:Phage tail protein domain-containing protein n=1 Tax=Streptomyces yunnanensis TaxID=156453 RepID=A0A9X8N9K4_9ACTN|nr:peptidase inhibitor family I36 protein [Streptomyces yunnanensis]SHN34096.1 phage tail protein domain-containing protein [Streptomyces yunnanensis]